MHEMVGASPQLMCNNLSDNEDSDLEKRLAALMGSPREEKAKDCEELPALDDLLQCFSAEGQFETKHKDLLKGFLTAESQKVLADLLVKQTSETIQSFILTQVCLMIFEQRFAVFKGEWELVSKKSRKAVRSQKQKSVDPEVQQSLDLIICAEE